MSEIKDGGVAGDRFSAIARKHRAALSPEERRVMALSRIADQAQKVYAKHKAVVDAQVERLKQLEAEAVKATQDFETAKAALEGK